MRVRCPNCHDATEIDDRAELSNIGCVSCGSVFSLVADHTISYTEAERKTIGHFELVDEIGVGAFGSVWVARDKQLERNVAVKIPRKGQLDPRETEQFVREARAAAVRVGVPHGPWRWRPTAGEIRAQALARELSSV